jgi:hypothetical protein
MYIVEGCPLIVAGIDEARYHTILHLLTPSLAVALTTFALDKRGPRNPALDSDDTDEETHAKYRQWKHVSPPPPYTPLPTCLTAADGLPSASPFSFLFINSCVLKSCELGGQEMLANKKSKKARDNFKLAQRIRLDKLHGIHNHVRLSFISY